MIFFFPNMDYYFSYLFYNIALLAVQLAQTLAWLAAVPCEYKDFEMETSLTVLSTKVSVSRNCSQQCRHVELGKLQSAVFLVWV